MSPSILLSTAVVALVALTTAAAAAASASGDGRLLPTPIGAGDEPAAPWHVSGLPDQRKPFTHFAVEPVDGRRAVRLDADRSYGNLVALLPEPADARHLAWQWRLDEPNARADLRAKAGDDTPAKVCLLFDLAEAQVPFVDRQLLKWARGRSADPVPGATLCYVWDAHLAPGTVLPNAFTGQLRQIVLKGADAPLHRWQQEQRDVHADFLRAFGDETQTVPRLLGVAIGADADNTQAHSVAHVGDISLEP